MDLSFRQTRLNHACKAQIKPLIRTFQMPAEEILYRSGSLSEGGDSGFVPYDGRPWGGKDVDAVFRFSLAIPPEMEGKPAILQLSTDGNGGWAAANPQPLVFVNGQIRQGMDSNHTTLLLAESARQGERYEVVCDCWSAMTEEKSFFAASLISVDRQTEGLYYDLAVGAETTAVLEDSHPQKDRMLTVLTDALDLVDLRRPHSPAYDQSVLAAREYLRENFYEAYSNHDMVLHAIGHTHIDVAWLWRLSATRKKTVRSFATVLELMKRYPEYRFSSSTPQIYRFVQEDAPELFGAVEEKIQEDRFEPEGAMWLEADCNLVSGESFVRQLVHGKRYFRDTFGKDSRLLWMPDVFGYSAALPQLLKKSGVDYFYTTKIGWNEYNSMPNDTFMWRGIDGSEVLTYFHEQNQDLRPATVARLWNKYKNKGLNREVMTAYGYGDGGGGPTEEMLEYGRRLKDGLPGVPAVHQGSMLEFMEDLEKKVRDNPRLPTWVGELYLEYHRGTYTSMARNKRYNRKAELALRDLEALASLLHVKLGAGYPGEQLYEMWEIVLLNQFHDIIPGSSIKEVYQDSDAQYADLFRRMDTLRGELTSLLAKAVGGKEGDWLILNTLGYPRSGYVTMDGQRRYVEAVPAMGWKRIPGKPADSCQALTFKDGVMENDFFRVRLDDNGEIASLYDKREGREAFSGVANRLTVYEDKPHNYDAWDINYYYREKPYPVGKALSIAVKEQTPETLAVEVQRHYLDSVICQTYRIYRETDRLDIETVLDWKERQMLLKAAFPLDVNADKASFDIQFGNVERPAHQNTSWDAAKFEVCAHKWADMSDSGYGVSILNDCKYGYSCQYGGLELTLLKSAVSPNEDADRERHTFTYAVYPHRGGWRQAQTVQQAYDLNIPMLAIPAFSAAGILSGEDSLVELTGEGVQLETVKQAYDGDDLIVRLYEYNNSRTRARLKFDRPVLAAQECDLLEQAEGEPLPVESGGKAFSFSVKPYEVKTFRIRLAPACTDQPCS